MVPLGYRSKGDVMAPSSCCECITKTLLLRSHREFVQLTHWQRMKSSLTSNTTFLGIITVNKRTSYWRFELDLRSCRHPRSLLELYVNLSWFLRPAKNSCWAAEEIAKLFRFSYEIWYILCYLKQLEPSLLPWKDNTMNEYSPHCSKIQSKNSLHKMNSSD